MFIGLKVYEYISLVGDGHGPGSNDFYLYYFILTGLHLFHVGVGIAVLAFLATQTRPITVSTTRLALVAGGACFWHLVDLLYLVS